MTILYVYAHPSPQSLNAAILRHALSVLEDNGSNVVLSNLYTEPFVAAAELKKIADADHIILQFPLWWFSTPAIMKDWIDRVLVKGFAYDTGKTFADGLLRGKTASLTITAQSPESAYQRNGIHGATLQEFLLPIHHALRFTGIETLEPFVVYEAVDISPERSEKIMGDYRGYLVSTLP